MLVRLLTAALLALPLAAPAVDAGPQDQGPPKRVRSVLLYGDEKCPPAEDPDEIVVCANVGDSPYRIPKRFRDAPKEGPASTSWARRAEVIQDVNRIGLPDSCSPVGMAGQSGCTRQFIRQWAQEKLEKEAREASVP